MLDKVVSELAARLRSEPNLDDYLGWYGGTLEYWLHIRLAGVGRQFGWSSRTEVPYCTRSPTRSAQSAEKWADAAIVLPDGTGVLAEIKTVPWREQLGSAITSVVLDAAALWSADWTRSLAWPEGYAGPEWKERRTTIRDAWGLVMALVHGPKPLANPDAALGKSLASGLGRLTARFAGVAPPAWLANVTDGLAKPSARHELEGDATAGVLYAWWAQLA